MDYVLSTLELVRRDAPENPVALARPQQVGIAARWFLDRFPGDVFYAVKANPSPWALDALWEAGVRAFDQFEDQPVYVVNSTFGGADGYGNTCSNGGGISSIGVSWSIYNSLFSHNRAPGGMRVWLRTT